MIGAANSLVNMHLNKGINQTDYLLVLQDFHDCFSIQMI
jgi:hypothetical protein